MARKQYCTIEFEIVMAMNQAVELVVYLVTLIHLDSLSAFQINFVSMPSDDLCIESKLEVNNKKDFEISTDIYTTS